MDDKWVITHTGVREAYEGKGIARKLVLKVIEPARAKGVKILPVCSGDFEETFQDILFACEAMLQGKDLT